MSNFTNGCFFTLQRKEAALLSFCSNCRQLEKLFFIPSRESISVAGPGDLTVSPDGSRAYVTSTDAAGSGVVVIDTATVLRIITERSVRLPRT